MNIGLNEQIREKSVQQLHELIANEFVLYVKTLKFHWNVKSSFFGSLHKLFNDQYEDLLKMIDDIAERCLALGLPSTGTLKEFLDAATVQEEPGVYPSYKNMIEQLVIDHEIVIRHIRSAAQKTQEWDDMGTNNFLLNLIEKHEKMAWMLRSYLE